jgi:hypothetical protein
MAWLAFARWTLYGWAVTLFEHAVNGVAALRGVLARVDQPKAGGLCPSCHGLTC